MNIQVQVGKSYKDNKGNVWECVAEGFLDKDPALEFLLRNFPGYVFNIPATYSSSFDQNYFYVIVDHKRKCYDSCKGDGFIFSRHSLVEEIVPAEKVQAKKTFVMHKTSKSFFCVDEEFNFCLFDDENETRYGVEGSGGLNWKYYIKVDITFDEYLELTGLQRKDSLKDSRNKLVESFGCQKILLSPILNKLEELLTEISKAKNQHSAIKRLELLSVYSIREMFHLKFMKLGGHVVLREVMEKDEEKTIGLFKEYIELFEKQLTKTTN